MSKILFIFLLIIISSLVAAQQKKYSLNINASDTLYLLKNKTGVKFFNDSVSAYQYMRMLLQELNSHGYITASFDTIKNNSTSINVYLNTGKQYNWNYILIDSINKEYFNKAGYKSKLYNNKPINYIAINTLQNKVIEQCENNGYPFAYTYFDSVCIENNSIGGILRLNKNNLILIDSIILTKKIKIHPSYIYNYIGIKPKDYYNEQRIKNISKRIAELSILKELSPPEINISENNAYIKLDITEVKANQFNGIIGIAPNNKTIGKLVLTGDIYLNLQNSFRRGETLLFNWQKSEIASQQLKAKATYPYLFSFPFGIESSLDLFKKDSSYITINTSLAVQFLMVGCNYAKSYYLNKKSSLLSTHLFENYSTLPPFADINVSLYGLGLYYSKLDYKYNPQKGYVINFNIAAGQKSIKKNLRLNQSIYKNIALNSLQSESDIELMLFKKITRNNVLMLRNLTGIMLNNTVLFDNELFKLGGLKNLRGIDEQSILASSYSIVTIEYRLLFEKNSNLFVFYDKAYYEKKSVSSSYCDSPFGVGLGITLQTKAGIFTMSYAIGKQFNNPIEFRNAKVHFGYVNRF